MDDRTVVSCDGCTTCCKNTHVLVHKALGDNESDYELELHSSGLRVLKKVEVNGVTQCVYLGETGCTIWDRAPALCREFDCRVVVQLSLPHREDVYEQGRIRLINAN